MSSGFAWLTEHSNEIHQQCFGKWIAVLNGQIIGVGETATDAAKQAEEKYPSADYILEAVDSELERI